MSGIQPASRTHALALSVIHAASFPRQQHWSAQAMALQLGLPGAFGLIDPRGGMVLARVAADEAEILTLAVIPERRRTGLGRALLRAAMAKSAIQGARTMFLEVAADNLAAYTLYCHAGFAQVGRRRRYYPDGTDALVMRVPLAPPLDHMGGSAD